MHKTIRILVANICILKSLFFYAPTSHSKPRYTSAFFYEFAPKTCRISLTGYGSTESCTYGLISVSNDSKESVNLHLLSSLGQLQLAIKEADSIVPMVYVVLIRSFANLATKKPEPTYYYDSDDGGIIKGICTPFPITRSTSGRCTVRLKGSKVLDVSFTTDSLEPAKNVQRSYE